VNEREIIKLLRSFAGPKNKELIRGIGDDCAVIRLDEKRMWLITMDTLVESVHFNPEWHPPDKLGRKVLAVNVSDIAAMGGKPSFAFLSLGLPGNFDPAWVEKFSRGLNQACQEYECSLAGGDTVRSPRGTVITLTVIGEVEADRIIYRNTARPGDEVWVSGTLGNAAAGLALCESGKAEDIAVAPLVDRHLNPAPRLELARRLSASGAVHSMMDISDGLATDLAHICEQSGTGSVIYADLMPVLPLLKKTAMDMKKDVLSWVLTGGEDFELLFTAPAESSVLLENIQGKEKFLTKIGYIDRKPGVRLVRGGPHNVDLPQIDISFKGYDHFTG